MAGRTRNDTVDIFRLIACFFVVFLHVKYTQTDSTLLDTIFLEARWGVPYFILLNGYFLQQGLEKYGQKAVIYTLIKLSLIVVVVNIIYIPASYMRDGLIYRWKYVLFGNYFHLWFLPSIMISSVLVYLLYWMKAKPWAYIVIIFTMIPLGLVMDSYSSLFGMHTYEVYTTFIRPVLTFPLMAIGVLFHIYAPMKKWLMPWLGITLVFVGYILQLAEGVTVDYLSGRDMSTHDLLIGMVLMSIGIFILAFTVEMKNETLAKWGKEYSLYIYLFHPLIAFVFEMKGWNLPFAGSLSLVYPLLIFFLTLGSAIVLDKYFNWIYLILTGSFGKEQLSALFKKKEIIKSPVS